MEGNTGHVTGIGGNGYLESSYLTGRTVRTDHGDLFLLLDWIPSEPPKEKQKAIDDLVKKWISPLANNKQKSITRQLLKTYEGLEVDTLRVLKYALKSKEFDAAVEEFKGFESSLNSIRYLPELRCISQRYYEFFRGIYRRFDKDNPFR